MSCDAVRGYIWRRCERQGVQRPLSPEVPPAWLTTRSGRKRKSVEMLDLSKNRKEKKGGEKMPSDPSPENKKEKKLTPRGHAGAPLGSVC